MTKTLWPSALAALLFFAACASTEETNGAPNTTPTAQARDCDISDQNRDLNNVLRTANQPDNSVGAVVAARHVEIAALGASAASGARAQPGTLREVACRSIALRAYGALLYSPVAAERDGALPAIRDLAEEGRAACDLLQQQNRLDDGSSADCDLIDMWHSTGPALGAGLSLQAVRARPNLEPVGDATWNEVASFTRDAASAMRGWANARAPRTTQMRPVVEEHRRRVVCHSFAPLVQMRNLNGRGSEAWQSVYVTEYPGMVASAAAAVPFPPSTIDQAHAVETFCGPHGPR